MDAVDPRGLALGPQQDEQTSVAEAPPLVGKRTQSVPQLGIQRSPRAIADQFLIGTDDGTGPPLRKAEGGLQKRRSLALGSRARNAVLR
jgi:hypothetical protein